MEEADVGRRFGVHSEGCIAEVDGPQGLCGVGCGCASMAAAGARVAVGTEGRQL